MRRLSTEFIYEKVKGKNNKTKNRASCLDIVVIVCLELDTVCPLNLDAVLR